VILGKDFEDSGYFEDFWVFGDSEYLRDFRDFEI
jgi:hypothetical protein